MELDMGGWGKARGPKEDVQLRVFQGKYPPPRRKLHSPDTVLVNCIKEELAAF